MDMIYFLAGALIMFLGVVTGVSINKPKNNSEDK